jgi:tetratricopeptide (TPR) repeat protein
MRDSIGRWFLYGGASAVVVGVACAWACTETEADVSVLLGSANVQLQAAYMTPAADREGAALSSRKELIATAIGHLESVERRRPGMAVTAEFRGFAHMLSGEQLLAAACYGRARDCDDCSDEQRDVVTFNQARMLASAGEGERALRVLDRNKRQLDARYGHSRRLKEAEILIELGRPEAAVQRLTVVSADAAAPPMARLEAGRRFLQLGHADAAEPLLEGACADQPIAAYDLARLKLRAGDVDESMELLERALMARPTEVRQRLRDEADAWSVVSQDARFLQLEVAPLASPGR